jgi:hypothetical protein
VRPVGLALAPLSHPMHRYLNHCVHVLQEGGFEPEDQVDAACGSINPWLKPFDRRMFSLMMCQSGWLGFEFVHVMMKFETCSPQCQTGRPRRGRSA